jgi:hypothetical protein
MTPKEKAKELVDKFQHSIEYVHLPESISKQCAFIAIDELILNCSHLEIYYWQQVKQEIENIIDK